MPAAFYRCPITHENIPTPTSEERSAVGRALYKVMTCPACNRGHIVNLRSGEVRT
jgi:hypothetical protein